MQDTIERKYLELLVDTYTNLLNGHMLETLTSLFCNYRKVQLEEVVKKEAEVISI